MRADIAATRAGRWDAIAAEWPPVLRRALPGVPWVPIPNLGEEVDAFIDAFGIDAVILAGGEDLAASPLRDQTERRLLALCLERGLPALGVCRGLEVVQDFFGGALRPTPDTHRKGRPHWVEVGDAAGRRLVGCDDLVVPSYHRWGVVADEIAAELLAWAVAGDGFVEGLRHRTAPIVAVMWHPERPLPDSSIADRLLRSLADGFPR